MKTFFVTLKSDEEIVEAIINFTDKEVYCLFLGSIRNHKVLRVTDSDSKQGLLTDYSTGMTQKITLDGPLEFEGPLTDEAAELCAALSAGDLTRANTCKPSAYTYEFISAVAA